MTLIFSVYGRAGMSCGNFHREALVRQDHLARCCGGAAEGAPASTPGRPSASLEAVGGAKRAAASCGASN